MMVMRPGGRVITTLIVRQRLRKEERGAQCASVVSDQVGQPGDGGPDFARDGHGVELCAHQMASTPRDAAGLAVVTRCLESIDGGVDDDRMAHRKLPWVVESAR